MTLLDLLEPHLKANGIDITADFDTMSISEIAILSQLGYLVYYKQPANASGSYGRCFFEKLQRQNRKEHVK